MKTYSFLGILTFLFFSLFIVSCQKTETVDADTHLNLETEAFLKELGTVSFYTPADIEEADLESYIASLTVTEVKQLIESYKIIKFIEEIGKTEAVINDYGQIEQFTYADLERYASSEELASFKDFKVDEAASMRWCQTITSWCRWGYKFRRQYCCSWSNGCYYKTTSSWGCDL